VSEVFKPLPSGKMLRWIAAQPAFELFITSITVAELLYGLHLLPPGKRRTELQYAIENKLNEFVDRILSFDRDAASVFAEITASRRKLGRPIGIMDAEIAAIAPHQGGAIATRDISDFQDCGMPLIDPWA
jgi:predicted nucleic acid-binding protein